MGKVFIKYSEPIDLNQYIENYIHISGTPS